MNITRVTDRFSVASQPELEAFSGFARDGFTTVLNNRPDGEEPGQPSAAAEADAARAAGLAYHHIPVTGADISEADVRAQQAAAADSDGPVLAHCRSGTRSLVLWVIGEVLDGRMTAEEVVPFGQKLGFDLRGVNAWLARHG